MQALVNCDIFTGDAVLHDQAILIRGEHIVDLVPLGALPDDCQVIDLENATVAPGLIDLQVNGGGDVLFNDYPSVETIKRIVHAHRAFGTTHLLPAYITGTDDGMIRAAEAVRSYVASGEAGVLGIHLEGPFLSPAKAGVHDASLMRSMTREDLALLPHYPRDLAVLLTVAPEVVERELLVAIKDKSIHLSAGHTNALRDEMREAFASGVTSATHLFNAMRAMESREPGVVGATLEDSRVYCGIIADGHHVHFGTLRVAWQAKARGRMYLVTDAMPPVGGQKMDFSIGQYRIELKDGRCQTEDGVLAGSALDMATAVRNCVQHIGVPKDEALRMGSTYPAEFLGFDDRLGHIAPGYEASLVILDNEINVRGTFVRGVAAWNAPPHAEMYADKR